MDKLNKPKEQKKVDQPAETPDEPIPTVDPNAPLKIDEVEEKEEDVPQEKSNQKLFVIGAILTGLVIIAVIVFLISARNNISEPVNSPEPTSTPVSSPSATPKITLVRSDWSLEVLNGSGVSGAAKKVADKLIALGYQVVKTGNADRDDYTNTQILVKKELLERIDLVIADLKDTAKIASVAGELNDSTASARIIIGKE